jgi:hypothetical protein
MHLLKKDHRTLFFLSSHIERKVSETYYVVLKCHSHYFSTALNIILSLLLSFFFFCFSPFLVLLASLDHRHTNKKKRAELMYRSAAFLIGFWSTVYVYTLLSQKFNFQSVLHRKTKCIFKKQSVRTLYSAGYTLSLKTLPI